MISVTTLANFPIVGAKLTKSCLYFVTGIGSISVSLEIILGWLNILLKLTYMEAHIVVVILI